MAKFKKYHRWLDDISREKCRRLAKYGFSVRVIAEQALGVVKDDMGIWRGVLAVPYPHSCKRKRSR